MATSPFDGQGRQIVSGQQAVAASSSGILATFTMEQGEVLVPMLGASGKSTPYIIRNGPFEIPTDRELRYAIRRTDVTDEYKLVWANGLEPCTIYYSIIAMKPR